jgi:hypothetical protein
MKQKSAALRVYGVLGTILAFALFAASPAQAQFRPRTLNEPPTGEQFHVEGAASFWYPDATIFVSSESLGIIGSTIDFKTDLGLTDQKMPAFKVVLTPGGAHKFRFEFIPIKYTQQQGTLKRQIIFNGQLYNVGLPVTSTIDWRAFRYAYEFDFYKNNRGFAGFIVEAKYTDVQVNLASTVATEFARARAPIPALGGIGRVYVVPNISVTFELTGFKLPQDLIKDTSAHYVDWDLYGTVNFTNRVGAQLGFRSLDVGYIDKADTGAFKLKGLYFGVVARY